MSAAEVNASRRLLCQALVELVCFAVSAASLASVRLGSERTGAGLVITLGPGGAEAATTSSAARRTPPTKIWEGRLEYLLAREFVEVAGGTLRFADDSGRGEWFSILVPLDGTASGNEGTAL